MSSEIASGRHSTPRGTLKSTWGKQRTPPPLSSFTSTDSGSGGHKRPFLEPQRSRSPLGYMPSTCVHKLPRMQRNICEVPGDPGKLLSTRQEGGVSKLEACARCSHAAKSFLETFPLERSEISLHSLSWQGVQFQVSNLIWCTVSPAVAFCANSSCACFTAGAASLREQASRAKGPWRCCSPCKSPHVCSPLSKAMLSSEGVCSHVR